jgi:hypothetical protein
MDHLRAGTRVLAVCRRCRICLTAAVPLGQTAVPAGMSDGVLHLHHDGDTSAGTQSGYGWCARQG